MTIKRLKILYITYEPPCFPGGMGGQTRQFCLLKELVRSHEIHYIGPDLPGAQSEALRALVHKCSFPAQRSFLNRVRSFILKHLDSGYPRFVQQMEVLRSELMPLFDQALRREQYDLIHVEHSNIAHWLHGFETSLPKILVAQNVKTAMWKRYAENAEGRKKKLLYRDHLRFKDYESRYLAEYDTVVAVSEVDKAQIAHLCPDTLLSVVANGVDIDYFRSFAANQEPDTLVFTGSMAHPPNNEAALHFCRNIFPRVLSVRPNVRLSIVGSSPSREVRALNNGHNITVTGFVDDTRPYLDSAAVVVVPLLGGSGTRLKIMEAMAMGKAIVSTSVGAEGIEYREGENILIADTDSTFADRVLNLLTDQSRCADLGRNARDLVEKKYSWPILAAQLEKVYIAAIGKKAHPIHSVAPQNREGSL